MKQVDLKLLDSLGARVPVRGGVPFPKGALKSLEQVRLRDADGNDVPFDAEAISLWPDGSVRWIRLDFVNPPGQQRLRLEYGTGVKKPSSGGLNVTQDAQTYFVDTGAMRFELSRRTFALLRNCIVTPTRKQRPALDPQGIDFATRGFFRRERRASKDEVSYSCELEELGPVHAVFRIFGAHEDKRGKLFDYHIRLYCYAGSAAVRLSYTLRSCQDDELPMARAVEMSVPLADSAITFSAGIESGYSLEDEVGDSIDLVQTGPTRMKPAERFQYVQDDTMVGRRSEGWITVSGEVVGVTAAVRRFWQQHPKAFEVRPDRLTVSLWPESVETPMVLPRGCEKTYEMMLLFHDVRDSDLADAALAARAFCKPEVLACTPSWYCASGAMGELIPAGSKEFESFGKAAAGAFTALKRRRAMYTEYGDFDYGDFSDSSDIDCWFNVEYDTPHCLLTQFARTSRRDYLDWGVDAASHQADIDIAHCVPADPNLVGSQSIHATGHLGRESKWFYYRTDHIWAQGLAKAYWLTGDRRYLDTAMLVGDYLARVKPCPDDGGAERSYAWSLIGLMAVYDVTGDAKYLSAAAEVADNVMEKSHPERGLWLREWGTDDCGRPILGNSSFMAGLLLEGMIDYNAVADRPEVDDFVVKSVRTLIREAWVETDGGFYYHPGVAGRRGRPTDTRQLLPLIYAYELTKDKSILDVALRNFGAAVKAHLASVEGQDVKGGAANDGKNYAIFLRSTPRFIAALRRMRVRAGS